MKTTVKIDAVSKEITMTKAAAKRASVVGTKEYKDLAQATRDFPNFAVKILSPRARAYNNKGLTIELMREIIKVNANGNSEIMEEFEIIRRRNTGTEFHFSAPKAYFLSKYPNWRESLETVEERQKVQEELDKQAKGEELQETEPTAERQEEQVQAEPVAAVDTLVQNLRF